MIRVERVYDQLTGERGLHFLVERLWPRGMKKENLHLNSWIKEVARAMHCGVGSAMIPKSCRSFAGAILQSWMKSRRRGGPLLEASRHDDISLLYSARDTEHNNALALKECLEAHLRKKSV